jgi:hypothetical protein
LRARAAAAPAVDAGPGEREEAVARGRVEEAPGDARAPLEPSAPAEPAAPTGVAIPGPDTWYERLLKFIPAESVALYLALEGIVRTPDLSPQAQQVWLAIVLALAVVFTWLYLGRTSEIPPSTTQLVVSSGALVVYVFAVGGVFATLGFWQPWQGTLLLIAATAFLSLYVPPPSLADDT